MLILFLYFHVVAVIDAVYVIGLLILAILLSCLFIVVAAVIDADAGILLFILVIQPPVSLTDSSPSESLCVGFCYGHSCC